MRAKASRDQALLQSRMVESNRRNWQGTWNGPRAVPSLLPLLLLLLPLALLLLPQNQSESSVLRLEKQVEENSKVPMVEEPCPKP